MDLIKNIYQKYTVLLILLLILPTFYTLLRPGFFPMQDDLQAFRIFEMDKCFGDFQFPCRWVPDAGYKYGYPQFLYYPPSMYYIGEFFHLAGFQFIDTVKILFILGYIFSTLTMFFFLKTFLDKWSAFVGSILYAYAPYKAVEVYVRGAMSEFWSLVIFPLIFWSSYQLVKTQKLKYFGLFALSVGFLLTTHNLMSIIFLPIAGIWVISLIMLEKKWKVLPKVFLSGLLGIGLAAFFTLPLIFERQFAHVESLVGGYFDYRQHFVDIYQLFFSNYFGFGSSFLGPGDDLSLSTGPIHWLMSAITLIIALVQFKKHKKLSILTFILGFISLGVLFLMHQKSSFIWSKIEILQWLQFPWRFMADSIFLVSLIPAIGIFFVKHQKLSYILGTTLIISVVMLHGSFFKPREWFNLTDQEKFSGILWQKQLTISIFDYLPIYAKLPPVTQAPDYPEVMAGKVEFLEYKKGSNLQMGRINVLEDANLRLPLFDFPGMEVKVSNKKIKHNHNDCRNQEFCLGLISFNVLKGEHIIKAELKNTLIRDIGDILTVLSFVVVGVILLKERLYEKIIN